MVPELDDVEAALTAPGADFEMGTTVVRGIELRYWKNAQPTLRDLLLASWAHGDVDFLVYDGDHPDAVAGRFDRLTFTAHFRAAAKFAHVLVDQYGIKPGDRVSIAMRNLPEWSIAFWGATAVGAIVAPLNAWGTGPELSYGVSDSGSRLVVCDYDRATRLADHLPNLPDLETVLVVRNPGDSLPADMTSFDDALGEVPAEIELPELTIESDDDATIFYTSGTTGLPKGALGTHRNICTNLASLAFAGARGEARNPNPVVADPDARAVYLMSVPFFHATGCHSILVGNMAQGGCIVLMYKWDPERALQLIEREGVTTFGGVPAMAWQVLEHPNFADYDLSSVRSIGYGGAPAAPELVRRLNAMFPGRTPSNGYGLTETSSVTTLNAGADYERKPDSVGRAVAVCDVKIVDVDGSEAPTGEIGELWIKGPNIIRGYWGKPEATAETIVDGWLRSGDIARIDDEGFVYVVDRAKDMIIRGGENIYCIEVETALFEHPAVTDAAAIGLPDKVLGEEVGAVVHLAPGTTATEDELQAFVAKRLATFKVPVQIWFRDEPLPRNPNGKILKRDLKVEVAANR